MKTNVPGFRGFRPSVGQILERLPQLFDKWQVDFGIFVVYHAAIVVYYAVIVVYYAAIVVYYAAIVV